MIVVVVATAEACQKKKKATAEATFSHPSTALCLCICLFVCFFLFFSLTLLSMEMLIFVFIIFRTQLSFPAKLFFCQAKFGKSYIFFQVAFAVLFQPPHKIKKKKLRHLNYHFLFYNVNIIFLDIMVR
jgi:hypothetical protein